MAWRQGYVPGAGRGMSGQYGNKVAAEDKEGDEQVPRPTEPSPQTTPHPLRTLPPPP